MGEFVNDEANGRVSWWGPEGERVEGQYVAGRANGPGRYYDKDGLLQFEGLFVNDEPVFGDYDYDYEEYAGEGSADYDEQNQTSEVIYREPRDETSDFGV